MAIFTQYDPGGLAAAIPQIGGILGQALQQRGQHERLQNLLTPQNQQSEGHLGNVLENSRQSTPFYSDEQILAIAQINPQLASIIERNQSSNQQRDYQNKKISQQEELTYVKLNQPSINKLNEQLEGLENTDIELTRLDELFKSNKLPSAFTAAMFDLEGEGGLSNLGKSQLSPEAQEAIKIIASQIRGISKIFPGRILQSEIQGFMKTLPGLINTPEGRERILRGMRIFNKMAQIKNNAILEEINSAGGSRKILYEDAVQKANKKIKPELDQLKDMYLNPDKRDFKSIPDPSLLKGEILIDDNTGQTFISDGIKWVPQSK